MKKLALLAVVLSLFAACSSTEDKPTTTTTTTTTQPEMPKEQPKGQADDSLVEAFGAVNGARPDWTLNPPENNGGEMFFIGMSKKFSNEQDSKKDAELNGRDSITSYLGTFVSDTFQKITTQFGLSSEVIDPTIAARGFQEQVSAAVVRGAQVKRNYYERRQNKLKENYFIWFSLVSFNKEAAEKAYSDSCDEQANKLREKAKTENNAQAKKQYEDAMAAFEDAKKKGLGVK